MRRLPALLLVLCAACVSTRPAVDAGFDWPVPEGWKHETIPFPLGFAPDLGLAGVEELRFMPGFLDPGSAGWWSYEFVWWLSEAPPLEAARLEPLLTAYFRGLAESVGGGRYAFDATRFRARLAPAHDAVGALLAGEIASYDPFRTGAPIDLRVEVRRRELPESGRVALFFRVSPRPAGDPVWNALAACAEGWRAR